MTKSILRLNVPGLHMAPASVPPAGPAAIPVGSHSAGSAKIFGATVPHDPPPPRAHTGAEEVAAPKSGVAVNGPAKTIFLGNPPAVRNAIRSPIGIPSDSPLGLA